MSYVIYHKETTSILKKKNGSDYYQSAAAAKAGLTRIASTISIINKSDYAIAESTTFRNSIEKYVMVKNLMSGEDVLQRINTPRCCSVNSEQYWSM